MFDGKITNLLDEQYQQVNAPNTAPKFIAEVLFNIIHVKKEYNIQDYYQPIYVDIKKFAYCYIQAADLANYGYDDIVYKKINDAIACINDIKIQYSLLCAIRRCLIVKGYDTDELSREISKKEMLIAWRTGKKAKAACLFMGSSFPRLLIIYLLYVIFVSIILLPAPFEWMGVFDVSLKDYCSTSFLNHIANTFALIIGNDNISPIVTPNCFLGVVLYCTGIVAFYFFIVNFVVKKIDDYMSIK